MKNVAKTTLPVQESERVCAQHGPYGPANFCCACTRATVESERDRYREALEHIQGCPDDGEMREVAREALEEMPCPAVGGLLCGADECLANGCVEEDPDV